MSVVRPFLCYRCDYGRHQACDGWGRTKPLRCKCECEYATAQAAAPIPRRHLHLLRHVFTTRKRIVVSV